MKKSVLVFALALGSIATYAASGNSTLDATVVEESVDSDISIVKTSKKDKSGNVVMSAELTNNGAEAVTLTWSVKQKGGYTSIPKEVTIEAGATLVLENITELKNGVTTDAVELIINNK